MLCAGGSSVAASRAAAAAATRRSRAARSAARPRSGCSAAAWEPSTCDSAGCASAACQRARPSLTRARSRSLAPSCDFLRYTREAGALEASLQTSVVSLELGAPAEPLRVDLVSAVHVGDAAYYVALQQRLSDYDRVCYELVVDKPPTPPGRRWRPAPPSLRRRVRNPVALAQRFIAAVLRLELQLEQLDYCACGACSLVAPSVAHYCAPPSAARENFYHADLELKEFLQLQRERDESWPQLLWRALEAEWACGAERDQAEPEAAWKRLLQWTHDTLPLPFFFQLVVRGALDQAEDRPLSRSPVVNTFLNWDIPSGIKLILAEQLAKDSVFSADALRGSVLVAERNNAAVAEVREAVQAGARRVAVVYGSAHMPDMERRLEDELGLRRVGASWLDAWRVPLPRENERRLQRRQIAALGALSLLLATDLSLWEQLLGWAGSWVGAHLPLR